jgi:TatD DNase family protein
VFDLGFLISFTGVITFKNAHTLREVVKYAPLEKIMIETDCPYLAPQKYRGQRNEPSYVVCVAEKIAEIKNISLEEVESKTTETAKKFFGIEQKNTVEIR